MVARNGRCPPPGKVPVPHVRWLERGWIKGSPYPRRSSPHSGDANNGEKCTISVSEREAAGIVGCKHPAAGRRVLILLGKAARRTKQADVYPERKLGFRADD
jgi:hypothetical protein